MLIIYVCRVQRESVKALQDARAKVLRLGSQVATASQEAAQHAKKEADAVLQLELERARAEAQLELLRQEVAKERAQRKSDERSADKELLNARADLLRLGSQVAVASQEAAKLARKKMIIEREKQEKELMIEECKAEQAYLREKAESEALARRECARQRDVPNKLRKGVRETSQRRLLAKKELSDRCAILAAEFEEVHHELSVLREQHDANVGAAKKLSLMPTWQHERRKGRRGGGMQLQYQHRLAI